MATPADPHGEKKYNLQILGGETYLEKFRWNIFSQKFRQGVGRQRGLARRNPSKARDLGLFCVPSFLCPLRRMWTHFWRAFWALFGVCLSPNPLPPTPFRNLRLKRPERACGHVSDRFSDLFSAFLKQFGVKLNFDWKKGKDPHPQDKIQHLDFTKDPRPVYYKTPPCVFYHKAVRSKAVFGP